MFNVRVRNFRFGGGRSEVRTSITYVQVPYYDSTYVVLLRL